MIQINLQELYQRLPHYLCILVWRHLLTPGLSEFDLAEEGFFLIPQKTKTFIGIIEFWILSTKTRALRIVNPLL